MGHSSGSEGLSALHRGPEGNRTSEPFFREPFSFLAVIAQPDPTVRTMDRPDLIPTIGMQKEARRYLRWKNAGHCGGTGIASRRAHQTIAAKPFPPATVQTMAAWFAHHAYHKAVGFRPEEDEYYEPRLGCPVRMGRGGSIADIHRFRESRKSGKIADTHQFSTDSQMG